MDDLDGKARTTDQQATFSRCEAEQLLSEAARASAAREAGAELSLDELTLAAEEAEIDPAMLEAAIHKLHSQRRRRRHQLGLVAVALGLAGVTAALVLLPLQRRAPADRQQVLIHNEHRRRGFAVDLLVPRSTARHRRRCANPPASRVSARDYCRLGRRYLAPGARVTVRVPDAPQGCPQLWVRVSDDHGSATSALFSLPASVEIERDGRLDQKGLGRPNMHGSPGTMAGIDRLEACSTQLAGGVR